MCRPIIIVANATPKPTYQRIWTYTDRPSNMRNDWVPCKACSYQSSTVPLVFILRFCVGLLTYPFGYNRTSFSTTSTVLVSSSKGSDLYVRRDYGHIIFWQCYSTIAFKMKLHCMPIYRPEDKGEDNTTGNAGSNHGSRDVGSMASMITWWLSSGERIRLNSST